MAWQITAIIIHATLVLIIISLVIAISNGLEKSKAIREGTIKLGIKKKQNKKVSCINCVYYHRGCMSAGGYGYYCRCPISKKKNYLTGEYDIEYLNINSNANGDCEYYEQESSFRLFMQKLTRENW